MMKALALTASVAALIAALSWPGNADPARYAAGTSAEITPPDEVIAKIRAAGIAPVGRVVRQGHFYVTHAIDPRGTEVRVVADTAFGDIVSITPARPMAPVYGHPGAGPRIIHVPGPEDIHARAEPRHDDQAALAGDDDDVPAVTPPQRRYQAPRDDYRARPSKPKRREAVRAPEPAPVPEPKPDVEVKAKRSVLSIPPDTIDGPPPVPSTPRWRNAEKKFTAPSEGAPPPVSPAAASPEAAQASANEPAVPPQIAPDKDEPPDGPVLDMNPAAVPASPQ